MSSRMRWRGGSDENRTIAMGRELRIGCINVGGKKGWRERVELQIERDRLDVLFVLGSRSKHSEAANFEDLLV